MLHYYYYYYYYYICTMQNGFHVKLNSYLFAQIHYLLFNMAGKYACISPVLHFTPDGLPHTVSGIIIHTFNFKRDINAGAENTFSVAKPLRTEKLNKFLMYLLNTASGSFIVWTLIPKAQDAMTSVVYLYIVSATSTGDPVKGPWRNSYYIFSYSLQLQPANIRIGVLPLQIL